MDNIDALVTEAHAVEDRLYNRLGTKSARGLDVDACAVISKMADALERQQAVVEAARVWKATGFKDSVAIMKATKELDQALAALDAPPEGDV